MALTNEQITAQNFKDFYGQIRPYLNGNVPTFANTFNKSDLYSTDEQLIGRWIDGKPIYQKVINCGATPSRACTFPHGISNLETVVLLRGIGRVNERWDFLPYPTPDSITYQVRLDILKSGNIRFSYGSGADLYQEVYVIIQYTKSTDSSMSISDGNEYSLDEQVVGKWIDGSPLYQKTYVFAPVQTSNSLGMTIDSTKLVNYFGLVVINDGSGQYSLPINCAHPDYQNLYGIFTHVLNDSVQIRTLNSAEWKLSNMKQLKITIQYLK